MKNKKIFVNLITAGAVFLFGIFAFALPTKAAVVEFSGQQISVDFDGLPFVLNNWAPGMGDAKTIKIQNDENFDIDVYLKTSRISLAPNPGEVDLVDALTLNVEASSKHISELFAQNIQLTSVNAEQSQDYNLEMNFDNSAGNEYQNKTIDFDFIITVAEIGSGGNGHGGGASLTIPGGGFIIPEIPTTDNGRVVATPGEGGITTLVNPDGGGIKLVIPSGTVEADTLFVVTMVDVNSLTLPPEGSGLFVVDGFAYQITATRNGQPVTTFPKSLVLTLTYTDEQIDNLDENSFKFYYFSNGEWITVNTTVNINDNTVTVFIDHLTIFALMGTEKTELKIVEESSSEVTPQVAGESTVAYNEETTKPSGATGETEGETQIALREEESPGIGLEKEKDNVIASTPPTSRLNAFLAAVGSAWGNLNKSAFYSILGIILLAILILIGIKIWREREKRKQR